MSAVQSRWLSGERGGPGSSGPGGNGSSVGGMGDQVRTPDVEAMDMDTYSRNLHAMNDSLHDLHSDIQRLAQQQSQIQQMMHSPQQQQAPAAPPHHNPMDPQPFYIAHDPPQQRRTWGQPQPINFAHQQQPPQGPDGGWQSPRRQQWGQQPNRPMGPNPYGYGPPSSYNPDPYSSPMRDPYGNPIYNGAPSPYDHYGGQGGRPGPPPNYGGPQGHPPPNGPYGYGSQNYPQGTSSPYGSQSYMGSPAGTPMPGGGPPSSGQMSGSGSRTPFRLHDKGPGSAGPSTPSPQQQPQMPLSRTPSSTLRRASESENNRDPIMNPSSYSRQVSRDSIGGPATPTPSVPAVAPPAPSDPLRRLHTSIPAPEEDDMAPQNVSFIASEPEEDEPDRASRKSRSSSPSDPLKRLPERLSQLNISSGSKTYRVHAASSASEKETSPSPTRQRPTISSTFKQARRSSGEGSSVPGSAGPSSLRSNSVVAGGSQISEEVAESLAAMKTERLKVIRPLFSILAPIEETKFERAGI